MRVLHIFTLMLAFAAHADDQAVPANDPAPAAPVQAQQAPEPTQPEEVPAVPPAEIRPEGKLENGTTDMMNPTTPMEANEQVRQISPMDDRNTSNIEDLVEALQNSRWADVDRDNQSATFGSSTSLIQSDSQAGIQSTGGSMLTIQHQNAHQIVNLILPTPGTTSPRGGSIVQPTGPLLPDPFSPATAQ